MTSSMGPAGRIAHFFIESKLTPLIVVAAMILGVFAVMNTPREEEPQIVVPMVDLFVGMPGASPEEVESRITIPLEKKMWEIPGVEYVYSASMPGLSMITVRFLVGEDQERSLVKLYDKIAGNMNQMPAGATLPLVKLRTIDDVPVLALTLWGQNYDSFQLRQIAAELAKEIAKLEDVSDIRLTGGQRRQVQVLLDPGRMAAFGVDPAAVAFALTVQNATMPAGSLEEGNRELLVETGAFLTDVESVRNIVVGVHGGRPVYLTDVAQVRDGPEEATTYVMFMPGPAAGARGIEVQPGQDLMTSAVTIAVSKRKGSDAEKVVRRAMQRVEDLQERLIPSDVQVTVTRDYGATSSEKARELLTHLILAILTVTLVIALFLGWRGGLVVFVSVPVTFALTLFVYYLFDFTLNRVTLFALIFVTGIVVDDSIIVVENIVRHFAMKKRPALDAAVFAVSEVGNPTILATFTVIAAVLPLAFVRGLMGPYMLPMPIGASLAMMFSLGIALSAAPWLAYRLLKGGHAHGQEAEDDALQKTWIYRIYHRILVPMVVAPWKGLLFLGAVTVLLVLSILMVPAKMVTVKMLPFDNKSELQIVIDMPEGTALERTTAVAQEIGEYLRTVPEVTDLQIYAGASAPYNFNGLVRHYDLRQGANVADLQVNLLPKHDREDQSHPIAKRIRPGIVEIGDRYGAAVKVLEIPPGPPVLSTLVAEVYGPDQDSRIGTAREILNIFKSTEGVVDVDWFVEERQPKTVFEVDREKAALHGVAAAQVARTLRLALAGEQVGVLHDPAATEPVSIQLRMPRAERSSVDRLQTVRVVSMNGALVPLSELVSVRKTEQQVSRHRKNLRPVVYVTGDVAGTEESPVYAIMALAEKIEELKSPAGTTVEQYYTDAPPTDEDVAMKWDGEWHITYEVFRDMGAAFGVVMILIYMLIIAWFKSFKVPLVMMISIPLSLVGVLPGHWLFGAFFTATSMIGFIALAGIMVRNAVLLIDFVHLSLAEGKSLGEAVVEAGAVRFRPILLTAGTVVAGAVVILFDPIFQGLAIALMGGAIASTVLTLVVVPLVYYIVERGNHEAPLPAEWLTKKEGKN
ncbi:MAG: efflux RND transporter permease subunit [Acidobacteria bacterium]|uniref:Efflux RND transporter permease subunit n=1 Tax=Candidatus Polarisedimenticola svalbardensis TaxID=2886004 RepID=A0A8J7CL06_9BACT|nr:efflux RND transporter permease subunit [Candidatus Polarisedimenticola svalbardensis]